jgi:hypothetical protein
MPLRRKPWNVYSVERGRDHVHSFSHTANNVLPDGLIGLQGFLNGQSLDIEATRKYPAQALLPRRPSPRRQQTSHSGGPVGLEGHSVKKARLNCDWMTPISSARGDVRQKRDLSFRHLLVGGDGLKPPTLSV